MDGIKLQPKTPFSLHKTAEKPQVKGKLDDVAFEFERILALQMVTEMTKGAFQTADNAIGSAGSELYRAQINESLASSLARQGSLGIARMLSDHWKNIEVKEPK